MKQEATEVPHARHGLNPRPSGRGARQDSQTGRLHRSTDAGRTWTEGTELQAIDLAAHAGKPDTVYATTPEGLQVSRDGGSTFQAVPSSPTLTFVDLPEPGTLVGLEPGGQVRVSLDEGRTWQLTGSLPDPINAFTAVDRDRLLAATESAVVYESRDGGKTFDAVFRPAAG